MKQFSQEHLDQIEDRMKFIDELCTSVNTKICLDWNPPHTFQIWFEKYYGDEYSRLIAERDFLISYLKG
jgi:hypothetical protein